MWLHPLIFTLGRAGKGWWTGVTALLFRCHCPRAIGIQRENVWNTWWNNNYIGPRRWDVTCWYGVIIMLFWYYVMNAFRTNIRKIAVGLRKTARIRVRENGYRLPGMIGENVPTNRSDRGYRGVCYRNWFRAAKRRKLPCRPPGVKVKRTRTTDIMRNITQPCR